MWRTLSLACFRAVSSKTAGGVVGSEWACRWPLAVSGIGGRLSSDPVQGSFLSTAISSRRMGLRNLAGRRRCTWPQGVSHASPWALLRGRGLNFDILSCAEQKCPHSVSLPRLLADGWRDIPDSVRPMGAFRGAVVPGGGGVGSHVAGLLRGPRRVVGRPPSSSGCIKVSRRPCSEPGMRGWRCAGVAPEWS